VTFLFLLMGTFLMKEPWIFCPIIQEVAMQVDSGLLVMNLCITLCLLRT
jgi:hypothetical protein